MKLWQGLVLIAALAGCARAAPDTLIGYGEADFVYVAPQDTGVIAQLNATEGDRVEAGAILFALAPARLGAAADTADAQERAQAERARAASAAALREAEAQRQLAAQNLARTEALFRDGFVSRARLEADRTALAAARAGAARIAAEQQAAERDLAAAAAQTRLARTRVRDLEVRAPAAGRIERVYRRPGEIAPAGEPVLALLPHEAIKIRFYAPEPLLARLRPGALVRFSCDGCPAGLQARVSFVAREPQFTPPVIFSEGARERLVFLVEARPTRPDAVRPGQPIEVSVADAR